MKNLPSGAKFIFQNLWWEWGCASGDLSLLCDDDFATTRCSLTVSVLVMELVMQDRLRARKARKTVLQKRVKNNGSHLWHPFMIARQISITRAP
eukprot:scaffold1697_cov180-Amphora_coffeaeformis.AAC.35